MKTDYEQLSERRNAGTKLAERKVQILRLSKTEISWVTVGFDIRGAGVLFDNERCIKTKTSDCGE